MKVLMNRLAGTVLLAAMVLASPTASRATDAGADADAGDDAARALSASVDQLRNAVGAWLVTTEFLNPDGSVARSVEGTYTFQWVVPDRVVSGISEIPALGQTSAILFYVSEAKGAIEMVSVGADGHLWIMTGTAGEETRYSQKFESRDGKPSQFRFTRFNASPDRFESRMEYTEDDGATWTPGNHQVFRRKK